MWCWGSAVFKKPLLVSFLYNATLILDSKALHFIITLQRQIQAILFPSPDDSKIIKVASSSLGPKRFFKCEDDTGQAVPVPDRPEDSVPKPATNIT